MNDFIEHLVGVQLDLMSKSVYERLGPVVLNLGSMSQFEAFRGLVYLTEIGIDK